MTLISGLVSGAVSGLTSGLISGGASRIDTASIVNVGPMRDILGQAETRLVDVILNSDSNGMYGVGDAYGWDHGIQHGALVKGRILYGSGVHGFGENSGGGSGVGYADDTDAPVFHQFRSGGGNNGMAAEGNIPAAMTAFWNSYNDPLEATGSPNHLMPSVWMSRTDPANDEAQLNGVTVGVNNPFGTKAGSRYLLWAGIFNATEYPSGARFRMRQLNGGADTIFSYFEATDSGANRVPEDPTEYDLVVQTDTTGSFDMRRQDPAVPTDTTAYPFYAAFQRTISAETKGVAVSVGFSPGGATSEHLYNYWNAMGETAMANHIKAVLWPQKDQSLSYQLLVVMSYGINDVSAGTTTADFKTYMEDTIQLYKDAWATISAPAGSKLRFALMVTHPTVSGDSNLADYRTACDEISAADSTVSSVNLNNITSYTELNTAGTPQHHAIGSNIAHLLTNSYDDSSYAILWKRVLDEILTDYDSDAQAYFTAVEATGATISDANKVAISDFVRSQKNFGLWDKKTDIGLFRAASTFTGAKIKLKGSSAVTSSGFLDGNYDPDTGLQGDLSGTKYIDLGVAAEDIGTLDDHHVAVYTPDVGSNSRYLIGATGNGAGGLALGSNDFSRDVNSSSAGAVATANNALNMITRVGSASFSIWAGLTENVISLASAGPMSTENVHLFTRLISGVPNSLSDGKISYYSMGAGLDDYDVFWDNFLVNNLIAELS